jgi:hypothetical protein
MAWKRLSRYSEHAMSHEEILYEGELSESLPPPPQNASPADRLQRLRAIIGALHDVLQLGAVEYSPHFSRRATVCDIVSEELGAIADELVAVTPQGGAL